ncbi:ribonuclease T [Novosphingobium sp. FKTRR1]|uniref:ribonuclease T2 family protein n=1 Tax=Novosphingobium sp. FKTRR1 TaxID=2879118 RepID=UPI001CF045D3|nr:ribonuclease T [Novosphingobium sp. FKTRR1]
MSAPRGALLTLLALAGPAPAVAQAWQCRVPRVVAVPPLPAPDGPQRLATGASAISGYTLALSWSPEFCRDHRSDPASATQCSGRSGRFGFILHGLWPEGTGGQWPQWCAASQPSAEALRGALCITPSPTLLVHEWAKHGSCMAKRPEDYFAKASSLTGALQFPDMARLSRKDALTAGDLRAAMVAANPGLRPSAIRVQASAGGWLQEMHLCLSASFRPDPCSRPGLPDGAPLKVWRSF